MLLVRFVVSLRLDHGLLDAREIMTLNLSADIAIPSACETARGWIRCGEGVIGVDVGHRGWLPQDRGQPVKRGIKKHNPIDDTSGARRRKRDNEFVR